MIRGIVVREGAVALEEFDEEFLGDGEVLVDVAYSDLNYKDALAVTGRPGVVRTTPLVAGIDVVGTVAEAVAGADVVLLLTEWQEYRDLDPVELRAMVRTPNIIDGRNVLDPQRWLDAGWTYRGMGRLAGPAAARAQV